MSAIQAASALTAEQEADDPVPDEPDMDVGDDTSSDAASYKPLGKSNARQWTAAIAMCQHLQQLLLYGSDTQPGLNTEPLIKMDMQNRRRAENERKNNSLVDAARLKPEMKQSFRCWLTTILDVRAEENSYLVSRVMPCMSTPCQAWPGDSRLETCASARS